MQSHQVSKTHYKVSDFISWERASTLILSPSFADPCGPLSPSLTWVFSDQVFGMGRS